VAVAAGAVVVAPALTRAADGTLAVVWTDGTATRSAVSRDGGATWSAPVTVGGAARSVAAAFTAGGILGVARNVPSGAGSSAVVSLSRDRGTSYGAPTPLDVAGAASSSRIALAGDSTGRFRAVWQQVTGTAAELRTATVG
jgi:hypothetical protein